MRYQIRKADFSDLERIESIYRYARQFMEDHGNPNQWGKTNPPTNQLIQDIKLGALYVVEDGDGIHGVFYFNVGDDPTYGQIEGAWHSEAPYGTIHRIAGDGFGGILSAAVAFGKSKIDHLRIDTHEDNKVMQNALAKQGFQKCGIIYIADGSPRIAYDLLTEEQV